MEYDNYVIEIDGENKTIYPLMKVNIQNRNILVYTDVIKSDYTKDDLFVGEEIDDTIIPVKESLIPQVEVFFEDIISKLEKQR